MRMPGNLAPAKPPDFSLLCYLQICSLSPLLIAAHTGQVMADQDSSSRTPIAVSTQYGPTILPVMESQSGGGRDRRYSPRGGILCLRLPSNDEADE